MSLFSGYVFIHACPKPLTQHVEWAISRVLGEVIRIDWIDQPAQPGSLRGEIYWQAKSSIGLDFVAELQGWPTLIFEITQETTVGLEGYRWAYSPSNGLFQSRIDAAGNTLVTENQVRSAMQRAGKNALKLQRELDQLLGAAWDSELDQYRGAAEEQNQVWLHRVAN